jgi:hypothetical protein
MQFAMGSIKDYQQLTSFWERRVWEGYDFSRAVEERRFSAA